MDRGNLHVLCFIEHHVVKPNLCLIELENYSLGSSFSHVILTIEVVFVFLLEKTCLIFKRRIKSRLPFAGIIRSSPYSTRFQDKG